jgi:ribosomal-protein-alanine N-acetyltransferase
METSTGPFPRLYTERLSLVLAETRSQAALCEFLLSNREHFAASSPRSAIETEWTAELCAKRIEADQDDFANDRGLRLTFFERSRPNGTVVGECAFTAFVRGPFQACYLGFRLNRNFVGRGLMQEGLREAIRYVFSELAMHRIMANHRPTNERSARVLRRLGFVVEGYARDYLMLDGAWRDHVLTSLTNAQEFSHLPSFR